MREINVIVNNKARLYRDFCLLSMAGVERWRTIMLAKCPQLTDDNMQCDRVHIIRLQYRRDKEYHLELSNKDIELLSSGTDDRESTIPLSLQ
jgi:hypothetical protein